MADKKADPAKKTLIVEFHHKESSETVKVEVETQAPTMLDAFDNEKLVDGKWETVRTSYDDALDLLEAKVGKDAATSYFVSWVGKPGEAKTYTIDATYSDYPEGGAWGDDVEGADHEAAEFMARWIMQENSGGRPMTDDFHDFVLGMQGHNIIDTTLKTVEIHDAIAMIAALRKAGPDESEAIGKKADEMLGLWKATRGKIPSLA